MSNIIKNKLLAYLAIIVAAVVLSTVIFTQNSFANVKPCLQSPACDAMTTKNGTLTVREFGFPRPYRVTSSFKPNQPANYASTTLEIKGVSYPTIVINIIFWCALLYALYTFLLKKRFESEREVTSQQ